MKAIQQNAYGPPSEVVTIVELPEPEPKPGEIVVELEAAAMHLADLKFINGDPGFRTFTFPRICGHEGLGHVIKLGAGVTEYKVGDRVFLPIGVGTFRQRIAALAADCPPAPAGDAQQLALTLINGMTAVILVDDYAGHVKPGEWILQNGANSSCGRYIIKLAHDKGVKTCNIVRRESLIKELKALDADQVIVETGNVDQTAELVKTVTAGAPISVGFDCVASTGTETIGRCLARDGTIVNYGYMTGKNCEVAFQDLFRKHVKLVGMSMQSPRTKEQRKAVYAKLSAMIAGGDLKAKIAATYTLDQIQEALAHQARTGDDRQGKIIILPNG
ncbi:MAG: zinc-dependent alcohol dehydrogenase family protein [Rhodospirillaceae bacterium]|nr:zinc-dependent alcohol dehydrogenase family protein [Rhodospirillaceae bacterium]